MFPCLPFPRCIQSSLRSLWAAMGQAAVAPSMSCSLATGGCGWAALLCAGRCIVVANMCLNGLNGHCRDSSPLWLPLPLPLPPQTPINCTSLPQSPPKLPHPYPQHRRIRRMAVLSPDPLKVHVQHLRDEVRCTYPSCHVFPGPAMCLHLITSHPPVPPLVCTAIMPFNT